MGKQKARQTGEEKVLLLRTCRPGGFSCNNFKWPLEVGSVVEAPDWNPRPECGGGLHGLLWGSGDGHLLNWFCDAKWLVIEANKSDVVEIDNQKAKCKKCKVVHVGNRKSATDYIFERCPNGTIVVGVQRIVGDSQSITVGYRGAVTAGNYGTATAGDEGQAIAGNSGTAIAGCRGTATAGDEGQAIAGNSGTAIAGDCGIATAGHFGTATAGDFGTATAGYEGTAIAGNFGTAKAGKKGKAKAGVFGQIQIKWYDDKTHQDRISIGYIGKNGLKPDTFYKCNSDGKFLQVSTEKENPDEDKR